MLQNNTKKLIVRSAIGMAGGCAIEFELQPYAVWHDEEDDEDYVDFQPETPQGYVWSLSLVGRGIQSYAPHKAGENCCPHFLSLVGQCATLALTGDFTDIARVMGEWNESHPSPFGESD